MMLQPAGIEPHLPLERDASLTVGHTGLEPAPQSDGYLKPARIPISPMAHMRLLQPICRQSLPRTTDGSRTHMEQAPLEPQSSAYTIPPLLRVHYQDRTDNLSGFNRPLCQTELRGHNGGCNRAYQFSAPTRPIIRSWPLRLPSKRI